MISFKIKHEGLNSTIQAYNGKMFIIEKKCLRKNFKKEFDNFEAELLKEKPDLKKAVEVMQESENEKKLKDMINSKLRNENVKIANEENIKKALSGCVSKIKVTNKAIDMLKNNEIKLNPKNENLNYDYLINKKFHYIGSRKIWTIKKIENNTITIKDEKRLITRDENLDLFFNAMNIKKNIILIKEMKLPGVIETKSKTIKIDYEKSLIVSENEKDNYKKYPMLKNLFSSRRFLDTFYFDHSNNNIVATNGKSLIRITANEIEKKLYADKKFISLNNKNYDAENLNYPPYEKVLAPDNETSFISGYSIQNLIKHLKDLKKEASTLKKEYKEALNNRVVFNSETMPEKYKQYNNFVYNDFSVYFSVPFQQFRLYAYYQKDTGYRYNLDLLLNTLITLNNIRDNQTDLKFTNTGMINVFKISNNNFDLLIMPLTN
jgi:hypothetical protein